MVERAKNYKTIKSYKVEEFDKEVEEYLSKGWLLFGHTCILDTKNGIQYIQTLIKG